MKRKNLTIVIGTIIIILLVGITGAERKNNTVQEGAIDNIISTAKVNKDKYIKATVVRVVDGDTVIANVDGKDKRIRFIGVNTPESTTRIEEYGKEASNYTKGILTENLTIYLEKDISETDKYDRLLRYIWLEVPENISESEIRNKLFNANLILNGYAEVATYPPDIKYVNHFINFEKEARKENKGLWGI